MIPLLVTLVLHSEKHSNGFNIPLILYKVVNRAAVGVWGTLGSVRISAYTNQSRVSHSVRMRENSAEEYPKQSSLERSF